jgi:2-dehydropantoate 2-reductase
VGAIGAHVAAQLHSANLGEVVCCVRRPFTELVVAIGDASIQCAVDVRTAPDGMQPADLVVLATKAHDTASAVPWLEQLCDPGSIVLVLQNGIDQEDRVRPYVGRAEVVPAVVRLGGELVAPGHALINNPGDLVLPDTAGGNAVAAIFASTSIRVQARSDFAEVLWSKYAVNLAVNGTTTLAMQPANRIAAPSLAGLSRAIIGECLDVASARGIELPGNLADQILARFGAYPDTVTSSMYQDRKRGSRLEHEALNATLVRLAGELNIEVPYNDSIAALLAGLDSGY